MFGAGPAARIPAERPQSAKRTPSSARDDEEPRQAEFASCRASTAVGACDLRRARHGARTVPQLGRCEPVIFLLDLSASNRRATVIPPLEVWRNASDSWVAGGVRSPLSRAGARLGGVFVPAGRRGKCFPAVGRIALGSSLSNRGHAHRRC